MPPIESCVNRVSLNATPERQTQANFICSRGRTESAVVHSPATCRTCRPLRPVSHRAVDPADCGRRPVKCLSELCSPHFHFHNDGETSAGAELFQAEGSEAASYRPDDTRTGILQQNPSGRLFPPVLEFIQVEQGRQSQIHRGQKTNWL